MITKAIMKIFQKKSNEPTIKVLSLRTLALETVKTINNINPYFMKYVFTSQIDARVKPNVILVKSDKTANYNDKSWTVLGPKIWNQLPQNIKSELCFSWWNEMTLYKDDFLGGCFASFATKAWTSFYFVFNNF